MVKDGKMMWKETVAANCIRDNSRAEASIGALRFRAGSVGLLEWKNGTFRHDATNTGQDSPQLHRAGRGDANQIVSWLSAVTECRYGADRLSCDTRSG